MSTNYYLLEAEGAELPDHWERVDLFIGKRAAAGTYCWDDRLTLCKGGEAAIHSGRAEWHQACPKCGQRPRQRSPEELEEPHRAFVPTPRGVLLVSSFTFHLAPRALRSCVARLSHPARSRIIACDDDRMSLAAFEEMLALRCPIHFFDPGDDWT